MLSVVVMAHPSRARFVDELLPDLPGAQVVWDRHNDRWDTGRRSMLAHDTDEGGWHLVVQDDAILCRDFLPGVEAMLAHVPRVPVSLYTGGCRPHGTAVKAAVARVKADAKRFLAMPGPLWGVAVAMPVELIEPMITDCDDRTGIANYDMRMATHFTTRRVSCWHTIPSLVNHRVGPGNPSLVPGRGAAPSRTALEWIGDTSPLEIDWSQGVLDATDRFHHTRPRQVGEKRRTRSMARIAPKTLFGTDGAGVRRRVPAGVPIPAGLRLEEPLPPVDNDPPEVRRLRSEQARRRAQEQPTDYSHLTKRPQLTAELDRRGIDYPKGPVANATLRELLEAADRQ